MLAQEEEIPEAKAVSKKKFNQDRFPPEGFRIHAEKNQTA